MLDNQESDVDSLELKDDLDRVLNPVWRDDFLAFMDMSHLGPERLMLWAQGLLQSYPADPSQVDRRHPLTLVTIERWLRKMYSEEELAERKARIREIETARGLACFLTTAPITYWSEEGERLLGTLIVAFEHRTETLVHHIIRHSMAAGDALHVAHKLVQTASKRVASINPDCPRYLLLPNQHEEEAEDWCTELRQFLEKNVPTRSVGQKALPRLNLPTDFTLVGKSRSVEIKLHGRRIITRHDLWIPSGYEAPFPPRAITCADDQGTNILHDLLAKAARKVRLRLAKTTKDSSPKPTWKGFSRARRPLPYRQCE